MINLMGKSVLVRKTKRIDVVGVIMIIPSAGRSLTVSRNAIDVIGIIVIMLKTIIRRNISMSDIVKVVLITIGRIVMIKLNRWCVSAVSGW